jgi:hypothetical protein
VLIVAWFEGNGLLVVLVVVLVVAVLVVLVLLVLLVLLVVLVLSGVVMGAEERDMFFMPSSREIEDIVGRV